MTDTVLAHLALKLTSQRENAATEALAFVFNRSPAARPALHRHMFDLVGEISAISRVVPQASASEESRADLKLLAGDKTAGFLEAKLPGRDRRHSGE